MSIDCVNIALDETPTDNTGNWWDSPLGWADWLTRINSRGDNDSVYLGCDHEYLRDRRTYERSFVVSASGTESGGQLYLLCGNIGSRIEPSVSQDSWWFIGDRPDPMRRQLPEGSHLLSFTGDYLTVEGIKARSYNEALRFYNPKNKLELLNTAFRNCRIGARFYGALSNSVIDRMAGRNIAASLLFFSANLTDCVISNITLVNTNIEDGEAIAIRLTGNNNQNVKIQDVVIGGQHDHYIGPDPKNPYHDGSEYSAYTQGEVLAIEGGSNIEIERVIGFDCTDRLIDCKAQCTIRDSGGAVSKRGITMWADNSHAYNCVIKSGRKYGNTPATAFLVFGTNSSLVDCGAVMQNRYFQATLIVGSGATVMVKGGEYIQPSDGPFVTKSGNGPDGPTLIELINVSINGVKYNQVITLVNNGDQWIPS